MTDSMCSVEGCASVARPIGLCIKHYKADHYQKNKARYDAQSRAWKDANSDRNKALLSAYYRAHPEKWMEAAGARDPERVHEYNAQYRSDNAAQIKLHRAAAYLTDREAVNLRGRLYYAANRESRNQAMRDWAARNPERARDIARNSKSRRRAREHGGTVGRADYRAILAEFGMVCHICKLPIASLADLHFDHVIPLACGGAHSTENIRPSHAFCNRSKGAKVP